jgi:oxygen-independent coproporphyrinogen-3 oxidase
MSTPRTPDASVEARFTAALAAPRSRHSYPLTSPVAAGAPEDLHAAGGPASLYLHVPFCTERCTYCFFVTQIGHGADDMSRYVEEARRELALLEEALARYRFVSLYYGGGTPGLLPAAQFRELHAAVAPLVASNCTITVETHPHAADAHRVAAWRDSGVDRVSMGVQTTDPALLKLINRGQTEAHLFPALARLLEAGFDDVNVDLLYGLPNQSLESFAQSLEQLIGTGVPSLSIYRTAFIPSTVAAFAERGGRRPDPEAAEALYALAFERLNQAGYHQPRYGSSTFSRLSYPYGLNAHRRTLVAGLPMVGVGMGAYGSLGTHAYANQSDRAAYQADLAAGRLPVRSAQAVSAAERPYKYAVEAWKQGFLCGEAYGSLFHEPLEARFGPELRTLTALGEIERVDAEYRLTRLGARHPEAVASMFIRPQAGGEL